MPQTSTEPTAPDESFDADQAVIDRVLAGDRNAFGILIERYSDPLYRHAYGMTGSADVAVMDPVITGTGTQRVNRGSAFNADNRFPDELGRASRRGTMLESVGVFQIGFRCVRTPLSP